MRLLLLVAVVAVPAIALTLRSGLERRADAAARAREQGLQVARAVASENLEMVDRTRELLLPIAALFAYQAAPAIVGGESCNRFLASLAGTGSIYASVGVTNASGEVECSSVPLAAPINLGDRAYFQEAMRSRGPSVGRFIVDRLSGKPTFNVAAPILGADGRPRGVAFAAIDLARIQPGAVVASLPAGSFAEVTDDQGTVLTRVPDPQRYVGSSLGDTPLFATMTARLEGTTDVSGAGGTGASLVAYTRLDELGARAFAIVGIPRSAAYAEADAALRRDLLVLAVVVAVALLAGWFASDRTVVRPLARVVHAAERIAEGDLGARVGPRYSGGELGALGRAFDAMGAALERRTAQLRDLNFTLERRVAARTRELSDANRELEAFSYSVSHDLRAPLRTVTGFSELLVEEYGTRLEPGAQQYLGRVRDGAQQMDRVIDDLLRLSRVSRGGLSRTPTELQTVVNGALDDVRSDLDGRAVDLEIGDLGAANVDATLMEHVYVNLLSNALKFTRTRSPARIEVGRDERDGVPVYFVRDNGVGFDMADTGRLFGVFQRLHDAGEYEGTGVGLAIVQRIIARHGGAIWADAAPDRGATFSFTLDAPAPMRTSDPAAG